MGPNHRTLSQHIIILRRSALTQYSSIIDTSHPSNGPGALPHHHRRRSTKTSSLLHLPQHPATPLLRIRLPRNISRAVHVLVFFLVHRLVEQVVVVVVPRGYGSSKLMLDWETHRPWHGHRHGRLLLHGEVRWHHSWHAECWWLLMMASASVVDPGLSLAVGDSWEAGVDELAGVPLHRGCGSCWSGDCLRYRSMVGPEMLKRSKGVEG